MMDRILIENAQIFLENQVINNGYLLIDRGIIVNISKEHIDVKDSVERIDGSDLSILPGFIDAHIHGANGSDIMDATESALETIALHLPCEGTTSFVATTITQSEAKINHALTTIGNYEKKQGEATLLGVHIEGPFIHPEKSGAHQTQYIIPTSRDLWNQWQYVAKGKIKTITIAPECDESNLISYLSDIGINVSLGHSTVNFQEVKTAVEKGVNQVTHLANAMTGIHHRDVGAVGAAFLLDDLLVEIIADQVHLSLEMLEISYRQIGSSRMMLITDAMRAKGLQAGTYELGGQSVKVENEKAYLKDGTIAGSVQTMIGNVKTMLGIPGVTLRDIVKMTAENPAKQLKVFQEKGSIAIGKDADLVLLDANTDIAYTICEGTIAYER